MKAILGVSNDITSIKDAENILKNKEILLEEIFENAPITMMLIDEKTKIVKLNNAGKSMEWQKTRSMLIFIRVWL
ncbi:MAG: hypothetical protein HC830_07085 [Bacteroidetes bacterium]|nr:hypothetical protein [Bacteroidota bacterium]